jgi:hypothetical protein
MKHSETYSTQRKASMNLSVAPPPADDVEIETEIAVRLGVDLLSGASEEECERAIGTLGLPFELVDFAMAPANLATLVGHVADVLGEISMEAVA